MERTVYQTLKYRGNNAIVKEHGPYKCEEENAWLHSGFYFWEEFIEPAHYWGKKHNSNNYIITKGKCYITPENLFDLVGNLVQRREFGEIIKELNNSKILNQDSTVRHVIDFLQKCGVFEYVACRADTTSSFKSYELRQIIYATSKETRLILNPAVQMCIYNLEKVSFKEFDIIYENIK